MKKTLSLLLAMMLCFSMVGCAKEQEVSSIAEESIIESSSLPVNNVIINGNQITFTIPRSVINSVARRETYEYIEMISISGVSATQNIDDSATITVDRATQQELLNDVWKPLIEDVVDRILDNDNTYFSQIEINETYSAVIIFASEDDYTEYQMSYVTSLLVPHCLHYQYWNAVESPSVSVMVVGGEPGNLGDILYTNVFSA